jgi:hypothetical protein
VEEGQLSGDAAIPPRRVDLAEVVQEVVEGALEEGDFDLISRWYMLLILHLSACYGDRALSQVSSAALGRIRQVAFATGASAIRHTYGYLARPPDEWLAASPLLRWWFLADAPMPS